jgi:hypothetical protein
MRRAILFCLLCSVSWGDGLPLAFMPNAGQFDPAVRFVVQTPDIRAAFLVDGAAFQAGESELRVRFVGASAQARIEGAGQLSGRANFLIGSDPASWRSGLPMFDHVVYRGLYPGIDANYAGFGRRLKSEFVVQPGSDPTSIRLEYPGASKVWIEGSELRVTVGSMEFREWAPEVYQTGRDGARVSIEAKYRIFDDNSVGFELGSYNHSLPLVIDPVITYATYLGGSGMGAVTSVARDGLGSLYATGWTGIHRFSDCGRVAGGEPGRRRFVRREI